MQHGIFKHSAYLGCCLIALGSLNACAAPTKNTSADALPIETALEKNVSAHQTFIKKMVSQYAFDRDELKSLLDKAELQPRILKAMSTPAEKRLEWYQYRRIFIKQARIDGGISFWKQHLSLLKQAEKKYGVPAEIIVAIIGVETRYGDNMGYHRVLDALVTLGFHFPRRATFFQGELEHFLLLCREEGLDPLTPKGSYAGAMGQSQFIASSYRHYAVDGDGDGKRDLWNNPADFINSVANYFSQHGWKTGQTITHQTSVKGQAYKEVLTKSLKPRHSLQNVANHQVQTPDNFKLTSKVKLLELQQADNAEYWLAFHNFYVITRYNHSQLYAMAVFQLSEEIKQRMLQH